MAFTHTKYSPTYHITPRIARDLMKIEALKERISHLAIPPSTLALHVQTIKLMRTHYSSLIEGNKLDPSQIHLILKDAKHFPGCEEDEKCVLGYFAALNQINEWVYESQSINEKMIQTLHGLAIGTSLPKNLGYREEQNIVFNTRTKAIVYMPPEASKVPILIKSLVNWIKESDELPCPIIAAIANHQLTSIHPYYAGNGRIARLLATLILGLGGYDLKDLCLLEEFYINNLNAYYEALSLAPLHTYYLGREEGDITPWIQYFIEGMVFSLENVLERACIVNQEELTDLWQRSLDVKQLKAIRIFQEFVTVKASAL